MSILDIYFIFARMIGNIRTTEDTLRNKTWMMSRKERKIRTRHKKEVKKLHSWQQLI